MKGAINYIRGNIFTTQHQTLVNTVNCVGIMGAGIALEFKYRYPEMFDRYVQFCKERKIQIGSLYIYDVPNSSRKILNFPTKNDWKHPSKIIYLEKGLEKFLSSYKEKGIVSAAFPLLGAQNGGLDPEDVKNLMRRQLEKCDIPVDIYEYAPESKDDLIDVFINGLLYSKKEFQKITGLSTTVVDKLRDVTTHGELNSLIQLVEIKGIGEETVKACFYFSMLHKENPLVMEQEIFPKGSFTPTTKEREPSIVESPIEQVDPIVLTLDQPRYDNLTPAPTDAPQAFKKHAAKKRKGSTKNKIITIEQKQLVTGLTESTIQRIEEKERNVTIADIEVYCKGMKLNPKSFLSKYLSKGQDDLAKSKKGNV